MNDLHSDTHNESEMITIKVAEDARPAGLLPPSFPDDYVAGVVAPFLLSTEFTGETPHLPMIDFVFSKEKAAPAHFWGMLYDGWTPNPEEEGRTVFIQGYENRGPDNERKRIYVSATTRDLVDNKYRPKIEAFFEKLLAPANAGTPLMKHYFDYYYDLYWDLHVGATGKDIPDDVRRFSSGFNSVLGYWFPTTEPVRDGYMETRATRHGLKAWLDTRIQRILDSKQPDADRTLVYYWLKNGQTGPNFRRIDILFECFHNFLAFSQWGNMIYNISERLEPTQGDADVRAWFKKTMSGKPDELDGQFTPLDRFVMELFRTINPNGGSMSILQRRRALTGAQLNGVVTPHDAASFSPLHWDEPMKFDPDRYKAAPTTVDNDAEAAKKVGLSRCPFAKTPFAFKDGRDGEINNSVFGAVYGEVDGKPQPLVDFAGYAPFGFGYRRCAGEYLTMEFVKEYVRRAWNDGLSFRRLDIDDPAKAPVNPGTVLLDNIAFERQASPRR
ncbi:hypothetical protein ACWGS9_19615 [Bradyrhizobium sp. Arg314]